MKWVIILFFLGLSYKIASATCENGDLFLERNK